MKKAFILMVFFVGLLGISFVAAANAVVQCSAPANNVAQNPEATIVVCDDPTDSTCEQDFSTLCPADWHLCSADEYNSGNDNWQGDVPTWLLGEITCRSSGGAGHYTVEDGGLFSNDVAFNQIAGSSLPQCQTNYGCNEKQYDALCCYGTSGNDVPEFGVIAVVVALIGALAVFIFIRK